MGRQMDHRRITPELKGQVAPRGISAFEQNVLALPDDAILRDSENEPFVYVQSGPTEFSRRQVTLGDSSNGRVQIKTGLKEGERVAGNGSLFLQFMNSLQH